MTIREITAFKPEIKQQIDDFLKLLVSRQALSSSTLLEELVFSDNSHLFFAFDEKGNCMGMLTLGIYISPTGKKACIEDVVVGKLYRGTGIGKSLMTFAIEFAKKKQVSLLQLTSNPARVAANNLYVKLGFHKKETNIYNLKFD
jgi:ribosomal protein S18 acetylase RimI-like enzyme